jgi:hypothetical protein
MYTLLYLLEGELPWIKMSDKPVKEQYKEVGRMKI